MNFASIFPRALRCAFALTACCLGAAAAGQDMHHQHDAATAGKPPVFVASTAKSFAALMHDAMAVMDDGMKRAPMNGVSEHDFVTMMIPHHQGAVDMAKGLLLYTKDPELRNLAQGIITEQQNEIKVMQAWLQRYQAAQAKVAPTSITKKE
jgi:uncharacterized protein (DUF305 family)